jgi:chromosome segregation ATPase
MLKKFSVITLGVFLIGTCASSFGAQGRKKAEKSIESMRKTREEIDKAKTQKDKTMVALGQLVGQSQADLKKPFKKFTEELKKLDKSAEKVRKLATDMRAKNQEFFKVWETELSNIQNPELQQKAGERRSQAIKQFEDLSPVFQSTRESFVSLMASLEDIRNYLSLDLSPTGIATISDMVKEAQTRNQAVDEGLAKVKQEMGEFAAEYSGGSS